MTDTPAFSLILPVFFRALVDDPALRPRAVMPPVNGDARAYPKRILAWHEMVRDRIGGTELTIVYCTLCGTVIPYGAEVGGERRTLHPTTVVLSTDTGFERDYSEGAAYRDYFRTDRLMFGVPKTDKRLKNKDEPCPLRGQ